MGDGFRCKLVVDLAAAEEVGKKPVTVMVILERVLPHRWTLPNAKTIYVGGWGIAEGFTCDPGEVEKAVAIAKRHHAEAKELIAQQRGLTGQAGRSICRPSARENERS
jgi:hypothetical protein